MSTSVLARTGVVNHADDVRVDCGTQQVHYLRVKTLKERLQFVLTKEFRGNKSAWATAAKVTRVHVAKLLERESTNRGKVELQVIDKLARAGKVSPGWLAFGVGQPGDAAWLVSPDPLVGNFLVKLAEPPGLKDWVYQHLDKLTVSQVWDVIAAYNESPSLARASDGQPKDGWDAFVDDVLAKRIGAPTAALGDASAVEELEQDQLEVSRSGLRLPPKKLRSPSEKGQPKKRKSG